MIKCEICGKEMAVVNYLHLRRHKISVGEYKILYPEALLYSEESKNKMSLASYQNYTSGKRDRGIGRKVNWSEKGMESLKVQGKRLGDSNVGRKHTVESTEKRAVKIRGKSYEELMGEERAKELKEDRKRCFDWVKEQGKVMENALRGSARAKYLMDNDIEYRERYCEMRKQVWANKSDEDRAKHISNSIKASHVFPNKVEQYIMSVLDFAFPNEWKYVGSGEVIIGRMNPDFINTNGQKKVIEVFGDYWHSEEVVGRDKKHEEQHRIDRFKDYGFQALILWETDIYNNMTKVRKRLLAFAGGL